MRSVAGRQAQRAGLTAAVEHAAFFPNGAYATGGVEPVRDFEASKASAGRFVQQRDEDSGMPMWQIEVSLHSSTLLCTPSPAGAGLAVTEASYSPSNSDHPLTSMVLPGCNMRNQNRVVISENAFGPHY